MSGRLPDRGDALDRNVRLEVYRHFLATGEAPSPMDLARRLSVSPVALERALFRLAAGHALVLLPGSPYIWMATPFSAAPTVCKVVGPHVSWWANCIWDALAIPGLAGVAARVETWCADCGEAIRIEVPRAGVVDDDCVAHFAVPAGRWWESLGYT